MQLYIFNEQWDEDKMSSDWIPKVSLPKQEYRSRHVMLKSLNVLGFRWSEKCICCLQAKLNLLHCCMEWLTIACEVCIFCLQVNVHRSLKLKSHWKKGFPLWKMELNTTEVRPNCLAWEDTFSLTKIYLKLITLCRYHRYYYWCSVLISCCPGCCWNISLVDLQEKEAQHKRHWR